MQCRRYTPKVSDVAACFVGSLQHASFRPRLLIGITCWGITAATTTTAATATAATCQATTTAATTTTTTATATSPNIPPLTPSLIRALLREGSGESATPVITI